ncbi:Rv0518 family GDSL lipase [Mycobacterium sp.]|uniref:Rv0518 family GDSL lipase n=1 Tax=Mycobacterium sp. TaxID=1785 RepID=UPI002D9A5162|nr:GDSL lipase [Mycobacterium sp.]
MARPAAFVVVLALLVSGFGHLHRVAPGYELQGRESPVNHVAVIGDSYTTGTNEGGQGPKTWTALAWQTLARQGLEVTADVASEGRAGYGVRGDHGSVFADLTLRAVKPEDALVVFFGSRNDQGADPELLGGMAGDAFDLARRAAPAATLLVIGPPWPTADVPESVLRIRDILRLRARAAGAVFVDPLAERWFVGRPDLIGADGVHPNDAGHAYMADKIAPLIRAQLPRRA